jgi:hypothetical protein
VIPTSADRRKPSGGAPPWLTTSDAAKWTRARAIAAEEQAMQEEYQEYKRGLAFRPAFVVPALQT